MKEQMREYLENRINEAKKWQYISFLQRRTIDKVAYDSIIIELKKAFKFLNSLEDEIGTNTRK